jgi:quinol-cytochrome oxidoreductase complex cytochrome b subunit
MLFVTGDTVAVLLILVAAALFFFLPFIDNKPAERKGKIITWLAFLLIVYAVAMSVWSLQTPSQPEPDKIVGAPQNIKESTAVYVFLGGIWLSIAMLTYLLRLKIKETDRLLEVGYFSSDKR